MGKIGKIVASTAIVTGLLVGGHAISQSKNISEISKNLNYVKNEKKSIVAEVSVMKDFKEYLNDRLNQKTDEYK